MKDKQSHMVQLDPEQATFAADALKEYEALKRVAAALKAKFGFELDVLHSRLMIPLGEGLSIDIPLSITLKGLN